MPREYLKTRPIGENALRTVVGLVLIAAIIGLTTLGGVVALQKFLLMLTMMAAAVGMVFMLFWYQIVKFPAWPVVLLGLASLVGAAYVYQDDIIGALGFQLLPFAIIGGEFTVTPMMVAVVVLGFLLVCVVCARRRLVL